MKGVGSTDTNADTNTDENTDTITDIATDTNADINTDENTETNHLLPSISVSWQWASAASITYSGAHGRTPRQTALLPAFEEDDDCDKNGDQSSLQ